MKKLYLNIITTFDAMSKGLFVSLIVGLLLANFGKTLNIELLVNVGFIAQIAMGSAIAISIASVFNYKKITLYTSSVVGLIGSGSISEANVHVGDPLTSLLVSVCVLFIINKIENNRVFDVLLIPISGVILSGLLYIVFKPVSNEILQFGEFISMSSNINYVSVILTSFVFAFAITGPISSAALAIITGISGELAFVALVATSAQMSGYFIMCLKDNGVINSLLVLFGSSKLLLKNVIAKPILFVPTAVASIITGLLAYIFTDLISIKEAAGMGLLGFTGQILTLEVIGYTFKNVSLVIFFCIIIPIIISYILYFILMKFNIIKKGDLKL